MSPSKRIGAAARERANSTVRLRFRPAAAVPEKRSSSPLLFLQKTTSSLLSRTALPCCRYLPANPHAFSLLNLNLNLPPFPNPPSLQPPKHTPASIQFPSCNPTTSCITKKLQTSTLLLHLHINLRHQPPSHTLNRPPSPSCPECILYVLQLGLYPQFVVITGLRSLHYLLYGVGAVSRDADCFKGSPQEADEEGHPVLPYGLRCFWNWYAESSNPLQTPTTPSDTSLTGRTTFVNTLCGKQVLQSKDADDAENAHVEEGVRIRPVTVGTSSRPFYCCLGS